MQLINSITASKIVNAINKEGYIVLPLVFDEPDLTSLYKRISALNHNDLKAAGIGRGDQNKNIKEIRRDYICWLDSRNEVDNNYLRWMESLRLVINQSLYLGLFDYEGHYAVYEPGSFYKKHLDSLKGLSNRMLSTVLYLNENWLAEDGGELLIYSEEENNIIKKVPPSYGTLVIFLSEQFPHEVLAANKLRYSIAGWFRVNASHSHCVDTLE